MENRIKEPVHLAGTARPAMDIGLRAKQFMPFAAVTGLEKALENKRHEVEEETKTSCDSTPFML